MTDSEEGLAGKRGKSKVNTSFLNFESFFLPKAEDLIEKRGKESRKNAGREQERERKKRNKKGRDNRERKEKEKKRKKEK